MNKKLHMVLIGVLFVSLMVSTASAAHNTAEMAKPTSNTGVEGCLSSCHTATKCISCHGVLPTFSLSVVANPTSVSSGSSTDVSFTVNKYNNIKYKNTTADGATVTLSGPGVSTSGTTSPAGIVTISVNPTIAGTINANATLTGFNSATTTVSVTELVVPVLTTISVSPTTANIIVGANQSFTASPKDQLGNPMVVAITWTSSNTTVGNVDASGKFTAAAAGTATIKAENGTVNGTATVTVTVPVLTTITVSPASANIIVGANQSFTAAPKDQLGNPMFVAISWTSSNTTVGNVDASGKFTAAAVGTATIKAENGTVNGTATVTVTATPPAPVLTTITVSPASANIIVGANKLFTAAPKDQLGNPIVVAITWTSSNTTVGNVDASGKFTAAAVGTATIKAENGTVNGTATVTVTTSPLPAKYYIVTFIVTDNVTGKPIKDAKVSIDGVKKETNRSGIAVFKHVSPGNHTYKIKAKHYTMIKGSIEVGANMTVSVKLTPKGKDDEKHEEKDDEHHDKDKKQEDKIKEKKDKDKETDEEDD